MNLFLSVSLFMLVSSGFISSAVSGGLRANAVGTNAVGMVDVSYVNEWSQFNGFLERFHKKYNTLEEFESRFATFR